MKPASSHQLIFTASGDPATQPLILIHGWLSHGGVWRSTVPALQDRFYCIAIDLLGFGDNAKPAKGDYRIAAQAQRVVALADELGFKTFNLIGHSMGGQIATHIAAITAPDRVERLISVDGVVTGRLAPFVEHFTVPMIRLGRQFPAVYDHIPSRTEKYPGLAKFMFRPWFYDMDFAPFDSWKIDRQMAAQKSLAVSAVKAYDSLRTTDLTSHLKMVKARTLVFSGIQDGTVPVAQARQLAERVNGAQLVLYDKCGHFPMFENTAAYNETLRTFVLN